MTDQREAWCLEPDCSARPHRLVVQSHTFDGTTSAPAPRLTEPLYIVFDGPPSHESGRFVEVENEAGGAGPSNAKWERHPTAPGLWRLGPFLAHAERSTPDD